MFFNFPSAAASTPSGTKIHFHSWSYLKTVKRKKEGKDDEESFLLSLRLTFLRRSFLLLWFHVSSVIAWWLVTLSHFMTWDFSSKSYETFTVVEQKMSKNIISFTRHEGCAAPFPHGSWIHKTWKLFALLSLFLIEFNYFFPFSFLQVCFLTFFVMMHLWSCLISFVCSVRNKGGILVFFSIILWFFWSCFGILENVSWELMEMGGKWVIESDLISFSWWINQDLVYFVHGRFGIRMIFEHPKRMLRNRKCMLVF